MTLVNSQPLLGGWELLPTQLPLPTPFSNNSSAEEATCATFSRSSHDPKQVGLFPISFSEHRDPPSTGPGARLIPWFLPGREGYPVQKLSNKPSLSASSLSLKNSSTIYLSCLIDDITGELGYIYSILYSSSTLILYQAPFPNPPTSTKQIINYCIYSRQTSPIYQLCWTHIKYKQIINDCIYFSPTPPRDQLRYTLSPSHNQQILMHQLRHLPKSSNNTCHAQRSICRTLFKSSNNTYYAQRSICRTLFSRHHSCKTFKAVNNYKSFRTASNLTKSRLPANQAYVKSINQNGLKNIFARLYTKRIKRRRSIRIQCDQDGESDRGSTSIAKHYKTRDA